MTDEAKTKDEVSKFVAMINEEGRVEVTITGPHVNNKTLNRIQLAIKKTYRNHIRAYRKQVKRDMNKVELDAIVTEPANLTVETNGRVLTPIIEPITEPIAKVIETKKLTIPELLALKDKRNEDKLAETNINLEGKD